MSDIKSINEPTVVRSAMLTPQSINEPTPLPERPPEPEVPTPLPERPPEPEVEPPGIVRDPDMPAEGYADPDELEEEIEAAEEEGDFKPMHRSKPRRKR